MKANSSCEMFNDLRISPIGGKHERNYMGMRKSRKAFTLAEVLITLGIIGVAMPTTRF